MSQSGGTTSGSGPLPPTVATSYVTDSGTAIPAANVLQILGDVGAAGSTPVQTTGATNVVTAIVQTSQAIASTDATKIGLAAFNSADFTVDANGFVSSTGGGGGTVDSIQGDTGAATTASAIYVTAGNPTTCGKTVLFTSDGTDHNVLSVTDAQLNTMIGNASGFTLTGSDNTALGSNSGQSVGNYNTCVGHQALTGGSGDSNTSIGQNSLAQLTTGSDNTVLGRLAGADYTTSESSNILLRHRGIVGDNNVMRLGTDGTGAGEIDQTFIAGIAGRTVSNTEFVTIDTTTGEMGSSVASPGGNVVGPGTSTDRAIPSFNGTGGNALFDNPTTNIDSTGRITNTAQPAFNVYLNAASSALTGDGTFATIPFDTLDFDNGGDFNLGTNTFTAPVTGVYLFTLNMYVSGINGTNTWLIASIAVNGTDYRSTTLSANNVQTSGEAIVSCTRMFKLTAGATVTGVGNVGGSGKNVVFGGDILRNSFSGYLVC